ncbi:MAG: tRNA (5-methylaminomethyl-2-thiouridine)(34)-methyltransferase MnmD [Bacteroidales bacterium]|nr:tRNA (5-methylaminomethyl-2-thiouridine)(34)-methyltransferase MnmD [Bacteroidales bacterium]
MIEIRKTLDGSHTLFVPELNEHYHSSFGAVQESLHVFIEAGLRIIQKRQEVINVLEVGFGTGLNALLTAIHSFGHVIYYTGVEAFPLDWEITKKLNYPAFLDYANSGAIFSKIHHAGWEQEYTITKNFTLLKIKAKMENFVPETNTYDLVYFDAFAPEVQPELWTKEVFGKLHNALTRGGLLLTYSSKGLVKQNLRASGFEVKRIAGPPGKRHMLRAVKQN